MMTSLCKKAPITDWEHLIRGWHGPGRGKRPNLKGQEKEITSETRLREARTMLEARDQREGSGEGAAEDDRERSGCRGVKAVTVRSEARRARSWGTEAKGHIQSTEENTWEDESLAQLKDLLARRGLSPHRTDLRQLTHCVAPPCMLTCLLSLLTTQHIFQVIHLTKFKPQIKHFFLLGLTDLSLNNEAVFQ